MISTVDLYDELKKMQVIIDNAEATPMEVAKAQLKATTLNTKLLHNLRTNSVNIMKYFKIDTVRARRPEGGDAKPQEA